MVSVVNAACGPRLNLIEKRELKQSFYNVGRYADPKDWAAYGRGRLEQYGAS